MQDVRALGRHRPSCDSLEGVSVAREKLLKTCSDIIAPLEQRVREVRPDIVYCQYGGDVNRDHELLFKAALVATRPTENCIGAIYAFDTASSTEWAFPRSFVPDMWVDISATLGAKCRALKAHRSQVGKGEWVDQLLKGWALRDGKRAGNGLRYAEAFKRMVLG